MTNVLVGDAATTLPGAEWRSLSDLSGLGMSPASGDALRRTLAERRAALANDGVPAADDGRAAWFWPGWRDQVVAWVDSVGCAVGFERRGEPEPVKIWSLSAVLRFPVTRAGVEADLWFKATCSGFHGEPALTEAIRALAPEVMPVVLAVDAERAWMLMEPIPHADDDTHACHAPEVARRLARLQIDTLGAREALRAAGAPHRGLEATLEWLHECVHASVEHPLMTEAQRAAAVAVEPRVADAVRELWGFGLPDTLSHGDLHLGNVAWVEGRPVFFDWTDACLTHPFLDAKHLADSAADEAPEEERDRIRRGVWEAYAEPWRQAFPDLDHDAAWARVRTAEAVFQMISYEQIYRAQPEASRWELATIVVEVLDLLVGELGVDRAGT